jgi:hypothetical protein
MPIVRIFARHMYDKTSTGLRQNPSDVRSPHQGWQCPTVAMGEVEARAQHGNTHAAGRDTTETWRRLVRPVRRRRRLRRATRGALAVHVLQRAVAPTAAVQARTGGD